MSDSASEVKHESHGCTGKGAKRRSNSGALMSLPVIGVVNGHAAGDDAITTSTGGKLPVRKSRNGVRRAWVLGIVQVLMILHILQWVWMGTTTTPIEPSEGMEFGKTGVINMGLIFFALALLATLILGRWFCGWGCHVVLLQDLCGWTMKKLGVRPRAFRSRLLMWVPLLLGAYMFLWPAFYRTVMVPTDAWAAQKFGSDSALVSGYRSAFAVVAVPLPGRLPPWKPERHLTTTTFWRTFPGVMIAVPTLLICGFGVVYFLGSKGFCTYGCPYGGFFAPLDKLAIGKIRVTDACEGCGHCTAVCTSNVRVHEEVREFGMVVDPGCMKCMDCVSVCPNEALYFGFGKPAVAKGPAKHETPVRKFDLSWGEEIVLAIIFAGTFFAFRGLYEIIPLLLAVGIAGIVAFLTWKLWRMVRDANVSLHRWQLKLRGRIKAAGFLWGALTIGMLAVTAHSGVVQLIVRMAGDADAKVTVSPRILFSDNPTQIPAPMAANADRAIRLYDLAGRLAPFAPGLWRGSMAAGSAKLWCAKLDFAKGQAGFERAIELGSMQDGFARLAALSMRSQRTEAKHEEARQFYQRILPDNLPLTGMLDDYAGWSRDEGRSAEVIEVLRKRLEKDPDNLHSLRWLAMLLQESFQLEEAIAVHRRTIEIDPTNKNVWAHLGEALLLYGERDEALQVFLEAVERNPDEYLLLMRVGSIYVEMGMPEKAQPYFDRANRSAGRPDR